MDERNKNAELAKKERLLLPIESNGDIRCALAYPNRYWVAMSNLGYQAVYRLLCSERRLRVERCYVPENDQEVCRTFESSDRLSRVELLALSVSFETDYPDVLRMIGDAGVDLEGRLNSADQPLPEEAVGSRPFILGGGAAITLNPEPLADFFDAILIGEAEEALPEITAAFVRARDRHVPLGAFLRELVEIEGVYVPRFFRPRYNADETLAGFDGTIPGVKRPRRRYVADIDSIPTHTIIQTPETEFKAMFMTETGRGCESGCRFCVSGYMYRPIRKRSKVALERTLQVGLEAGRSVGFVGAAVSSHPAIAELASGVALSGKRAALSSIMSQRVTPELAASLSESEYHSVALAPEAGSEKLRFRIGKRVLDRQIINAAAILAGAGIRSLKLYFMVGLPGEQPDDVEQIAKLAERVRDAALEAARLRPEFSVTPEVFLSVNPFIPKAWTPFQRHAFLRLPDVKRRVNVVRDGIRRLANVSMKAESARETYFQVVMSRGDRRVGALLAELKASGGDWRNLAKVGKNPLRPGMPASDFYVYRTLGSGEVLPWELTDFLVRRDLLEREYGRALSEDASAVEAQIAVAEKRLS